MSVLAPTPVGLFFLFSFLKRKRASNIYKGFLNLLLMAKIRQISE